MTRREKIRTVEELFNRGWTSKGMVEKNLWNTLDFLVGKEIKRALHTKSGIFIAEGKQTIYIS